MPAFRVLILLRDELTGQVDEIKDTGVIVATSGNMPHNWEQIGEAVHEELVEYESDWCEHR